MATILIVDDRPANREYLVTLLGYSGHRLLEATDGAAALAVARAERPDLVIADIVMPTMDGYELARELRADPVLAAIKIVFFTSSYVVAETRRLAGAVGVSHIIAKPAEPQEILDVVSAALQAPPVPVGPPVPDDFQREHMRLLTDTLAKKVEELEAEIGERKQAEAALWASEKRFRALIENSSDAISLLGPEGHLTYVSPSTTRILGYTNEESVGTDPASLIHPDDLPAVLGQLAGLIEDPTRTVTTSYRVRHHDGRWRWIDTSIRNLLAEPDVRALVFNYRDSTDRVEAEAQLRLQSAALNAAANAIVITDRAGVIVWVNPAFTTLTGYPAAAVIGQSTRLLKSGEQPPEFYRQMWTTIAAGEVWHGELVNRRQDGRLYTQEQTITPVRDAAGQITHYVAIQQDVTERRAAERQLRYLATVLEHAAEGIVSTDTQMVVLSWNPGATAIFGFDAAEVIGRPFGEVMPYQNLEADDAHALEQLNQTGYWKGEMAVRRKDGRSAYVLVSAAALRDDAGRVIGFSAVLHDITERKQAEAALAASAADLRALFAAMTDVVLVMGADGRYLQIAPTNPPDGLRPPVALLGRTIHEVLPPAEAALYQTRITEVLADGQPRRVEYVLTIDGAQVWFDATIAPMSAGTVIGIARDITERVQREREVEAMAAVSTALRAASTRAEMAPIILAQVTTLLGAAAVALALRDEQTGELVVVEGQGEMAGLAGKRLPPGAGIGGQVVASGRPYVAANGPADPHFYQLNWVQTARAVACVPLLTGHGVLGVLWAGRPTPFTPLEVRVLTAIADIAAGAMQRAGLHEQTEARLRQLAALRQIDNAIMNSLDLQTTLVILLSHLAVQLAVHACDILLLNPNLNVLEYAVGRGFRSTLIEQSRVRVGMGHAGQAVLQRRMVIVPDLRADTAHFVRHGLLAEESFVALYCVPLAVKGRVVGVLEVWHRAALSPDADWLAYLETLAGQAAIAVADAQMFGNLQRSNTELRLAYDTTLEGWSAALDLRDKDTEGHSQRVTELTLQLARALGVSGSQLEHIRRGALLHDIGKMGIPDSILHKSGPLSDDERAIMRQHPQFAYRLLAPIPFLQPALDIPYCHHEWWDGTGYPRGLKGDVIPLAARIFAVVDVWDALCSDRPYRSRWPVDKVLAYLAERSGTQFDPEVVQAFLALHTP